MADYDDLSQINALMMEQQKINDALVLLDDWNGTISTYTVIQGPVETRVMDPEVPQPSPPMPAQITPIDPGQSLLSGVRSSLIQRYNVINQELRELGVTGGPPDHAGGPPVSGARPG